MRNLPITLFAAAFLAVNAAHAQDTVTYTLSGNYPTQTLPSAFTGSGEPFAFTFTLAATAPASQTLDWQGNLQTGQSILSGSYTEGGITTLVAGGQYNYASWYFPETEIRLATAAGDILISANPGDMGNPGASLPALFGKPDAQGNSHFLTGSLGSGTLDGVEWHSGDWLGYVNNLSVNVSGEANPGMDPVPEMSTMGLMAVGLISCGGVAFLRRRRAPLTA